MRLFYSLAILVGVSVLALLGVSSACFGGIIALDAQNNNVPYQNVNTKSLGYGSDPLNGGKRHAAAFVYANNDNVRFKGANFWAAYDLRFDKVAPIDILFTAWNDNTIQAYGMDEFGDWLIKKPDGTLDLTGGSYDRIPDIGTSKTTEYWMPLTPTNNTDKAWRGVKLTIGFGSFVLDPANNMLKDEFVPAGMTDLDFDFNRIVENGKAGNDLVIDPNGQNSTDTGMTLVTEKNKPDTFSRIDESNTKPIQIGRGGTFHWSIDVPNWDKIPEKYRFMDKDTQGNPMEAYKFTIRVEPVPQVAAQIPEPSTLTLFSLGVACLCLCGWRRWRQGVKTVIFSALSLCRVVMLLAGVVLFLSQPLPVHATHITLAGRDILRPPMLNEGYLSFHHAGPTTFNGDERTGWTDIRHPALDRTVDNRRGYDWSDFQVTVRTHNVNAPGGNSTVTGALRRQDFNVANAIYAQAGVTVRHEENVTIIGNNITADAMGNPSVASLSDLFGTSRSRNGTTVNAYYVDDLPSRTRGVALPPQSFPTRNSGFAVSDETRTQAGNGTSTFSHELGHFLLDRHRFAAADNWHSTAADDLMLVRPLHPGLAAKDGGTFGLREPGRANGNIGTHSHLGANVRHLAGGAAITQIDAMHRSPFVQHADNGFTHADVADFDWVEDNIHLEQAGNDTVNYRGDNHIRPPGNQRDFLLWEIANIAPSRHTGHDHDAWGALDLTRFNGRFFRRVDVVSQIGRYVDMDVRDGNWNARESALDYDLEFSADGRNWVGRDGGVAVTDVFVLGWTDRSDAENWVARWDSPMDARFVRIRALTASGHDGNTQIDAVIAALQDAPPPPGPNPSPIPEPPTLTLLGMGVLCLCFYGWRQRKRAAELSDAEEERNLL
jgi:hypothetical protein